VFEPGCFVGDLLVVENEAGCVVHVRSGFLWDPERMDGWLTLPDVVGETRSAASRRDIVESDFGHCCWMKIISEDERMVCGCRLGLVMRWMVWTGCIDMI
jgi:hypothetical protein